MQLRVIVHYLRRDIAPEVFHNAEVAIAQPGLFVVRDHKGNTLGMFPIGEVAVVFPDGPARISEVTL